MATKKQAIENRASTLLTQAGVTSAPVQVERIVRFLGLSLRPAELGDGVSGILVLQDGKGLIGYSASDSPVRQRFSIAHEIGHYVLHKAEAQLFIDKPVAVALFRDENSATGEQWREIQANQFAAALLMPKELVRAEFQKVNFSLDDEQILEWMAKKFDVSVRAMSIRLASLELIQVAD